ncbi:MAG: hypothetical protein ABEH90_09915 [Halolamina sp.]
MNDVEPGESVQVDDTVPVMQYEQLSPDAQRAFDRAQGVERSVAVYGDRCPDEFSYSVQQSRYVVVKGESRYVLTTYANDLIPEVPIAAGVLAVLGLLLVGIGVATRDDPDAMFPLVAAGVGLLALLGMAGAIALDRYVVAAIGLTAVTIAGTLVGAGAALGRRHALVLGGVLSLVAAAVLVPLVSLSALMLIPAVLPLALVGVGIGAERLVNGVAERTS